VLFTLASSLSAQLWGQSVAWSRRVEERQEALQRVDADLLRRERGLRRAAAEQAAGNEAAAMTCQAATDWLRERLAGMAADLPAGLEQRLELADPPALWLVAEVKAHRIVRRRLISPAAHGLCLAALPAPSEREA
jgi:hypothetical protein